MDALEIARGYLRRGWIPIPVPFRTKGPKLVGWQNLRPTEEELPHLFRGKTNIGILNGPSGLIDVDLDHMVAVQIAAEFLPQTPAVFGRAGKPRSHWLYKGSAPYLKLCAVDGDGEIHTVVEIRTIGQTVFPGSVHESGEPIEWASDGEPETVDPTQAVRDLFAAFLERTGFTQIHEEPECEPVSAPRLNDGTRPGDDYNARGDVVSLLRAHGWVPVRDDGDSSKWRRPGKSTGISASLRGGAFYVFTTSTRLRARAAYSPFALYAALEHGGNYDNAASALATQGFGSKPEPDPIGEVAAAAFLKTASKEAFPADCLSPPGLLSRVIEHNLRTSMYPLPELALGAALGLVATYTGRRVTDAYGTRTNGYFLGLAPSGAGKEHARQINKELLLRGGMERAIGPERIASSAGLVSFVCERLTLFLQLDEMSNLLETMKNPAKSPHLYNIGTVLMQLYASSGGLWIGDAYADTKKTKTANQPHCVVYGTSTPEAFWGSLTVDNVNNGLLGRMLAFESTKLPAWKKPERLDWPEDVIEEIRRWGQFANSGNLSEANPEPFVAEHSLVAAARFEQHMRDINERRAGDTEQASGLWARSGGKVGKLALLLACSRCWGHPPRVELEDVQRAIKIGNWLTRRMLAQAGEYVGETDREVKAKRLLRIIGRRKMSSAELTRKTQFLYRKERDEIIIDLVHAGALAEEHEQTGGRPVTYFRRQSCNA